MNNTQKRVALVLRRMADMAERDEEDASAFAEELESMLDAMHGNNFFGTEGQCDPRGDFRNGDWSMNRIEGLDG